jgi:hypothetical protein
VFCRVTSVVVTSMSLFTIQDLIGMETLTFYCNWIVMIYLAIMLRIRFVSAVSQLDRVW